MKILVTAIVPVLAYNAQPGDSFEIEQKFMLELVKRNIARPATAEESLKFRKAQAAKKAE